MKAVELLLGLVLAMIVLACGTGGGGFDRGPDAKREANLRHAEAIDRLVPEEGILRPARLRAIIEAIRTVHEERELRRLVAALGHVVEARRPAHAIRWDLPLTLDVAEPPVESPGRDRAGHLFHPFHEQLRQTVQMGPGGGRDRQRRQVGERRIAAPAVGLQRLPALVTELTREGDGTLFYPGTTDRIGGKSHVPIESLRLKHLRDGLEDFEYLHLARSLGLQREADAFARALAPQPFHISRSPREWEAARLKLAEKLTEQAKEKGELTRRDRVEGR